MLYNLVQGSITAEPVSLAEAKMHLRVDDDSTSEDALILALVRAAREWVENYCRRSLVSRTITLRMDCFPGEILLPRGPVSSVTSVQYVDADGATQTVTASDYQTDLYSVVARILPVLGVVWPQVKNGAVNSVIVTYVAGYATATELPRSIKAAMLLIVGHLFEHREQVGPAGMVEVPFAVKALLAPFEVRDFTLE